jgi:predicted DNA binding CopG/RHH family protein
MKKKPIDMPKFLNEEAEADWWVSRQGREFLKQKSVGRLKKGSLPRGSRLVGQLNRSTSVQIALRLLHSDVTKAREIAIRKGIGYQTLLTMLMHEGLRREARRP